MRPAVVRSFLYFFISLSFSPLSFSAGNEPVLATCSSALSQVSHYVEAKRQLAAVRYNSGAMSSDAYQQLVIELDDVEASVSMEKCMAASGDDFQLYQCLADNKGRYADCR